MQVRCAACLFLGLLGCASTQGPETQVQPYGPDRFIVTYDSIYGVGKARNATVRDANEYCGRRQLAMVPIDESVTRANRSSVSLVFACATAQDDPYEQAKGICADLYKEDSDDYKSCVVQLLASRLHQEPQYQEPQYQQPEYPRSTDVGPSEEQLREIYRQERIREQILQHGKGGWDLSRVLWKKGMA